MNLQKSIELLQMDLDDPGSIDISDLNKAQELGIEALKRILKERNMGAGADWGHLPGETNEGTARGARALLT